MKQFSIGGLILLSSLLLSFYVMPKEKVNWISFAELDKQYAQKPKPIIIDLYTSWCGWCKVMDKKTYGDKRVAAYINEHYYAVKFNAESKDSVRFNKAGYGYNKQYRTNDVAIMLSMGDLSYPNSVFLERIDANPAPIAGYLTVAEIETPLRYFVEKNEGESFADFSKRMKPLWK